jgi:hypothetical protein
MLAALAVLAAVLPALDAAPGRDVAGQGRLCLPGLPGAALPQLEGERLTRGPA